MSYNAFTLCNKNIVKSSRELHLTYYPLAYKLLLTVIIMNKKIAKNETPTGYQLLLKTLFKWGALIISV